MYFRPLDVTLFLLYVLIGPFTWLTYGVLMYAGRRKMDLLRRPPDPLKVDPPKVTILIPAKDEGERIRACVESALGQDYPNFDVVAIDDRSTDNTGAVMDEIAAGHPRLKVFHNTVAPPPGWTGKNNALHQGQKHADGGWLLFVDSDVVLERDVLSSSVEMLLRKGFDMFSLLPRLESHSTWEGLLVPLCAGAASSIYLVPLTNKHEMTSAAFANGQYLMVSRRAYDAIGGHETVRDRFCEDVEIARLLKAQGWKPRVALGKQWCSVRMYNSLGNIFKGWSRIFYAGRAGSPWPILAGLFALVFCSFSAYAGFAYGLWRYLHPVGPPSQPYNWAWLAAGAIHLVIFTWFLGTMYRWSGNARYYALLFPLSGTFLLATFLKALTMCVTKKVEWRGTSYSHVMADTLGTPAHSSNPQ